MKQSSSRPGKPSGALTHVDKAGRARMVDVGAKPFTEREAVARGEIYINSAALRLVRRRLVTKGDPLETARLAGILGAKATPALIPLCHPLPLSHVAVDLTPLRNKRGYMIQAIARTTAQTGVEMEALTAVTIAALTVYDMLKAADREMVIGNIRLIAKKGGRSGNYRRAEQH